ncbi:MAG: asparagine synthase (glutamine-hydrolyzing), partial [Myxococcales bacterium]|nr:asparagine synthase (glutamine-hydrolyzing) [Myxococcales bacterium]
MCGITGFLDFTRSSTDEVLRAEVQAMSRTLTHRGPDDEGLWTDPAAGVALGHRRLSIVDLSAEGHQPMTSSTGRYVIVYNGEVYNFGELRAELEPRGHRFRGHSDTEVILAAVTEWGFEQALTRFNGMFAIALWDRTERTLWLARDRIGIKPVYYGWIGGRFLFGSELKAIRAHSGAAVEIDRDALTQFLRHCYVPAPYSIYREIRKLPPGSFARIPTNDASARPDPVTYWSAVEVAAQGARDPFEGSPEEIVEALDRLLRSAVRYRMIADVPLGAFLSGGIDSGLVVAAMAGLSPDPVRTFTIGFEEAAYDERALARSVSAQYRTDHEERVVPASSLELLPLLVRRYGEPFADSSAIPTYRVSQLAREQVTVALSGDGG